MRFTETRKEFLSHLHSNPEMEEFVIAEAKRILALHLINHLPYKVEEAVTEHGMKYKISLDIAVEDYKDFATKYLQNSESISL